jgi:excisionase family DNA binding protein
MTAREVARESGIGLLSIYRLLKSGELPSIKCGKVFYVPRAALAKWLESPSERGDA